MRKILSLIAAVLFAGGMMATTVSKTVEELATAKSWENATVVTPFDFDEVIAVSTDASDANTGKYYSNGQQVRLYQTGNATVTLTAAEGYTISSITLTYASQNTGILVEAESGVAVPFENVQSATFTVGNSGNATNGQVRITAIEVTYDGEGGEIIPATNYYLVGSVIGWAADEDYKLAANQAVEGEYTIDYTAAVGEGLKVLGVQGETEIWYPDGMGNEYVVATAGDYTVHFRPEGNVEGWYEGYFYPELHETPVEYPSNCAEAAEAALSVSANNELYNDGAVYTIEGYVTSIKTAYSDQYHNISFWIADTEDGGEVLQAYRATCASEEDAPVVGDKVAVTGTLTKYNTTPEFSAACTFEIIEHATPVPPVEYPTNCAEAAEAALSVENNNDLYNDGAVYTIEGYVTYIQTPYSDQYHNITFWMADAPNGGNVLEAYRAACASEEDAPVVGDKVAVTGTLTKYNTTPEFSAACTFEIIEHATPVPVEYPSNCAEAAEAALSVENNNDLYNDGAVYTIEGYVTSIKTAYSDQYHNISFWIADTEDGGEVLQAYRAACASEEDAPVVGDKVAVTGTLTKYNTTPEFSAACTFEIIEHATPVPVEYPSNCAEAAEAALSVENNNDLYNDGAVYTIEGYVTSIKTAYSDQYHNISFWIADTEDGGEVLQAYRAACASEEDAPVVGDKVAVTGTLTKYNTTPEFSAACTFEIIEHATPVPVEYPTNCAEAAEAALSVENNNDLYNDGAVYTIEGYVTSIKTAYSDQYHNISFWMADTQDGGEVLQAYRAACASEEDAPAVGDKVAVTGSLTKYNNTPEFAAACTFEIIERAGDDTTAVEGPTNCAEAAEAALSVSENNELYNDGAVYTIEGYVTSIKTAYSDQYHNISFWMADTQDGGEVLQAFRAACASEEDAPAVGDKVAVTGSLTKYNNTPEFAAACTFEIIERAGDDTTAVEGPTNCVEAAEAALSVSANNELYNDGAVYTIEGYVTSIKTAYSDQYHNISFWIADTEDGGEVLQAYRATCASEEDAPVVGDKVAVTGSLTKYNNIPEFAAACTFEIIEHATPVEEYYVVGTMTEWTAGYEDYKLVANPDNEGEYMIEALPLEAATELKIVSALDGNIITWYPDGTNNNFVIAEDGYYNIYFRPEGGVEGWYYGYFNIELYQEEIEVYEVAEAIAAGLQDDDEVAVRGVISRMTIKGKNFAKYGSVTIFVADATGEEGEFEFYNCYSLAADTFRITEPAYDATSTQTIELEAAADANGNTIHVGDTVIAFGKYQLYNTTHELNTGCYLLYIEPASPATGIDNVDAATQATKLIENGQFVIIKNGVWYNAQGAVIRR